jgi:hypothetical protein
MFYNSLKSSASSNFEYIRLATSVNGVLRATAYNVGHSTHVQIVPAYGGYPDTTMKEAVQSQLDIYQNVRNNAIVINPKYTHIDATVRLDPISSQSWDATILPAALNIIKSFLSPISTFNKGKSYYANWGQTIKTGELSYLLFAILGGTYIGNLYIDKFARHGETGASDIVLNFDELSNIGVITVINNLNPEAPVSSTLSRIS